MTQPVNLLDNVGLRPDPDAPWDSTTEPHPDSLRLVHDLVLHLHAGADLTQTPLRLDLYELAYALEHAFERAHERVCAGADLTLEYLTYLPAPPPALPGGDGVQGLTDEVLSAYTALAALCQSLARRMPAPLCEVLEVRAGHLRAEGLTLRRLLAEQRQATAVAQVESSLEDDLAVAYDTVAALHRLAAQQCTRSRAAGRAAYHQRCARVLTDPQRVADGGIA